MSRRTLQLALVALSLSLCLGAGGASAQADAAPEGPGIWIADATGDLREVRPSAATFLRPQPAAGEVQLVFSVDSHARSANGALSAGQLAVTRVIAALSANGVSTGGIRSQLAYVEPRYRERLLAGSWERPHRLGFDAGYIITVRATSSSPLGLLIDAAIGAGATRVLAVEPEEPGALQ